MNFDEDINLFLDFTNVRKLRYLLSHIPDNVSEISAAIAYTSRINNTANDISLIDICIKKKIKLNWWGLFNAEGATDLEEIKKSLMHPDLITFYPFSEYFHPKVIWFHGYGIYIGSHNASYNAMMYNIEAGVFILENSLTDLQEKDIKEFFLYLKQNSNPAVAEDLERFEDYINFTNIERKEKEKIQNKLDNYFDEQFSHMFKLIPAIQSGQASTKEEKKKEREIKRKEKFITEWRETQNIIAYIKEIISRDCKHPSWIRSDAHITIITDQVLHAYYYSYLLKGSDEKKSSDIILKSYEENKHRTEDAIRNAIKWWEKLDKPPSSENVYINDWGLSNHNILSNLEYRDLTKQELNTVMLQNHAARNHARQIRNSELKLEPNYTTNIEERVKLYVDFLYKQKSINGLTINDVLKYLLFGDAVLEERIYRSIYEEKYKLEHFGRSIAGEILGWGRPDISFIRNNRVNKALRCLGFNVELFSE